jgi:hypothetical protein
VYAHILLAEDRHISRLIDGRPLLLGEFRSNCGMSEIPPEGDWTDWARRVRVDIAILRAYGRAVYQQTLRYVDTLSPDDLGHKVALPGGAVTLGWWLPTVAISHANSHCGEISAVKGLQGARGYPI